MPFVHLAFAIFASYSFSLASIVEVKSNKVLPDKACSGSAKSEYNKLRENLWDVRKEISPFKSWSELDEYVRCHWSDGPPTKDEDRIKYKNFVAAKPYFEAAAKAYNLPVALLVCSAMRESSFNPKASAECTDEHCIGLGQFKPSTAKLLSDAIKRGMTYEQTLDEHVIAQDLKADDFYRKAIVKDDTAYAKVQAALAKGEAQRIETNEKVMARLENKKKKIEEWNKYLANPPRWATEKDLTYTKSMVASFSRHIELGNEYLEKSRSQTTSEWANDPTPPPPFMSDLTRESIKKEILNAVRMQKDEAKKTDGELTKLQKERQEGDRKVLDAFKDAEMAKAYLEYDKLAPERPKPPYNPKDPKLQDSLTTMRSGIALIAAYATKNTQLMREKILQLRRNPKLQNMELETNEELMIASIFHKAGPGNIVDTFKDGFTFDQLAAHLCPEPSAMNRISDPLRQTLNYQDCNGSHNKAGRLAVNDPKAYEKYEYLMAMRSCMLSGNNNPITPAKGVYQCINQ